MTYQRLSNKNNTTGATSVAGTDCPYGAHVFTPGFSCGSPFLIYWVVYCRSLFVFFIWSLSCLSFFDLWLHITPLVSSNISETFLANAT